MNFHSQLETLPVEKEHYKKAFLEIRTFGWPWAFEHVILAEDFLEEYAENLDWQKILRYQDYSVEFEEKFKYKFKSVCRFIEAASTQSDIVSFINTASFKNYNLTRMLSSTSTDEGDSFIGCKLIFSGPKGREIYDRVHEVIEFTRSKETKKIHVEFDEQTKKNSMVVRADTVKKHELEVIFIS